MKNEAPISMKMASYGGIFIHNVLETKDEPILEGYASFLEYWEDKSGQSAPSECQSDDSHKNQDGSDADKTDLVGAHVRIDDSACPDDWAWIVPLCKHCNNDDNTGCMKLPKGTIFVPIKMSAKHPTAKNDMDCWVKSLKMWDNK